MVLPDGRCYWTVVDEDYVKVEVADHFLFDLRFGRDRAESTSRVYASELARFLGWCRGPGQGSLEDAARHLSRFVLSLRTTPTTRPGAGQGRPPGPGRVNHVLAVVREFFKHAAANGAVDGEVLAALYEVADDRFLPAELRPEGEACATGPGLGTGYGRLARGPQRRRPSKSGRRCSRRQVAGGTGFCSSCFGFAA